MPLSELEALQEVRGVILPELKAWKMLMDQLADAFHHRFPPRGLWHGWTLHVVRCARSKKCQMCPHGIVWRKYYIVALSDSKRFEARANGKNLRKLSFIWGNKPEDICRKSLPPHLYLRPEIRKVFMQYEEVRSTIMNTHHALSNAHKNILLRMYRLERFYTTSLTEPYLYKWKCLAFESADMRTSTTARIWQLLDFSRPGADRMFP